MDPSRAQSPSSKTRAGPATASSRSRVVQFADTSTTIVFEQQAVRHVKQVCHFFVSFYLRLLTSWLVRVSVCIVL
jgi:hypothetical protein